MMNLKASPLGSIKIGHETSVQIRELPGINAIDLRVAPASETQLALEAALSIKFPKKTGEIVMSDESPNNENLILSLAPDWWLLVGFQNSEKALATMQLETDHHFSFVNVSGQRTSIDLEGPNAQQVLSHVWEQDLRDKTFPVSRVAQGLMAKAPVILCHLAPNFYRILVRSSFAVHLWQVLVDAAEEYR